MTKVRILTFLTTLFVVGGFGTIGIFFARGYRIDTKSLELIPRGLLVANSEPNGAQVFVDDELKTATDNTLKLSPGIHNIVIKKEGYLVWEKQIEIVKEEVSQIDAFLVSTAPSLSALTYSGAFNPVANHNLTKIAYGIAEGDNGEKAGIWLFETVNLPLGLSRNSRQITNGDMTEATWKWSPDSSEILLTIETGLPTGKASTYLLDASKYTPQNQLIKTTEIELEEIKLKWKEENAKKLASSLNKLPDELTDIFTAKATDILFSPDEDKILYTASGSAQIPEDLIKPLPGASTQKQERHIVSGKKYVYDTKEDRNFLVGNKEDILHWLPNSLNIISPKEDKIVLQDYDGTNKLTIFTGNYVFPHVYPSSSTNRVMILTNLGAQDSPTNLYWLSLK